MLVAYTIYQLPNRHPNKFRSLENDVVDLNNYNEVYSGTIFQLDDVSDFGVLEELFKKFNLHHPPDFRGHSLSVSDLVKLDDKYYYCQSIGWKEVKVGS